MKNIIANYANEGITINLSSLIRHINKGIKGFLKANNFDFDDVEDISDGTKGILSWLKDFLAISNKPT